MTDSDKDLKLLLLRGIYRRPGECRLQNFSLKKTGSLPYSEFFNARRQAGSGRGWGGGRAFIIDPWLRSPRQHLRVAAGILLCMLALIASFAGYGTRSLLTGESKSQAGQPEIRLATSGQGYQAVAQWVNTLFNRRVEAQNLVLPEVNEDFVATQINSLMREFGAEEYSVPLDFVHEVDRYIQIYKERDRELIVRTLVDQRENVNRVREILRKDRMPEDFAYMALVESGFVRSSESREGAAGFWQFTEATAREYGLKVEPEVDERLDLLKSTQAASRYLRDLILDFGSGSSVMLAMAAYNSGPEAVRRAVRSVKDPIKQRNFWYLYQTHALPAETREYVPKVFAAIIVGRSPREFGF